MCTKLDPVVTRNFWEDVWYNKEKETFRNVTTECSFHGSTAVSHTEKSCAHWAFQKKVFEWGAGMFSGWLLPIPDLIYGFLHDAFNFFPSLKYHLPQTRNSYFVLWCGNLFQKLYSCLAPGSEEAAIVIACGTVISRFILGTWKYFSI